MRLNNVKKMGVLCIVFVFILPLDLLNAEEHFDSESESIDTNYSNEYIEQDIEKNNDLDKDEQPSVEDEQPSVEDEQPTTESSETEKTNKEIETNESQNSTEKGTKPVNEKRELNKEKIDPEEKEIPVLNNAKTSSELRVGDNNAEVKELKIKLAKVGFKVSNYPNNKFGPTTEKKIKEFQKYFNLHVSGIANVETMEKINSVLQSPYRNGQSNQETIQLKKNLEILGFKVSNNPNTKFGPTTEQRVKEFQEFYKLVKNGIADEVTLAKINELLNTPMKRGDYRKDAIDFKYRLAKLGFIVSNNPTPAYGKATERKVLEFQNYYGINQTGQADSQTLRKLNDNYYSILQKGKSIDDVLKLKKNLEKLGFKVSDYPNTSFGPSTEGKVREFQKYYGLVQNGIVDEITAEKISYLLNNPMQIGHSRKDVIYLKQDLAKLGFKISNIPNGNFGPKTERKVKEFQKYYNIKQTGIADETTLSKIEDILSTDFQKGKKGPDIIQFKDNLAQLGYKISNNPNENYGPATEKKVKEFQKENNLVVNGIGDEITRAKIDELIEQLNKKPINSTTYTEYNITLDEAIAIQMEQRVITTDKYRDFSAYVSANTNYLRLTGPAQISGSKVNLRSSPSSLEPNVLVVANKGETINIISSEFGDSLSSNKLFYKVSYMDKARVYYVHSTLITGNNAQSIVSTLNIRSGAGSGNPVIALLKRNETVKVLSSVRGWYKINSSWLRPIRSDLQQYLDPNNNDKFQHLRLDKLAGATASQLNSVLPQNNSNVLYQTGGSFVKGARDSGINEAYLVSHALLETGNGTSKLAKGVEVGKNSKGELVLVTTNNRNSLTSIKTTYNMFGIGAVDSDPVRRGAIRAYREGWFTPAAAIEGGAKWVGQSYIYNQYNQNTLYKMRWNPQMANGAAWKQYASDIGWATKQVTRIKQIYEKIDNADMHYDIPKYN